MDIKNHKLSCIASGFLLLFLFLQPFGKSYWLAAIGMLVCGVVWLSGSQNRASLANGALLRWWAFFGACFFVPAACSLVSTVDVARTLKYVSLYPLFMLLGLSIALLITISTRVVYGFLGLLIFWAFTVFVQFVDPVWNPFGPRSAYTQGVFSESFSGSLMIGMVIGPMLAIMLFWFMKERKYFLAVSSFSLVAILDVLSGTRASLIGPLITLPVLIVFLLCQRKLSTRQFAIGSFCLAVLVYVMSIFAYQSPYGSKIDDVINAFAHSDIESINRALSGRLDIWKDAINVGLLHPLTGAGADNFRFAQPLVAAPDSMWIKEVFDNGEYRLRGAFHTHQFLMDAWAGTGAIGIFGMVLFYSGLAILLFKALRLGDEVAIGAMAAVWVVVFPLSVHNNLFGSWMSAWIWIWLGLALGSMYKTQFNSETCKDDSNE